MNELEANRITTQYNQPPPERLVIPGGWTIRVPEIEPVRSCQMFRGLVRYQMQGSGFDATAQAELDIEDRIQRGFESWWVRELSDSIRRWAGIYAERFPELVQSDGTLRGFDPERMAQWFLPYENEGRSGKPGARMDLLEMGREVKRG